MAGAIENFSKSFNNTFPKQIVIFRDGVGYSQKKMVLETEIPQFKAALSQYEATKEAKLCVIMVNKRVKTKFVQNNNGRVENPLPGSVIDHTITGQDNWEWYMLSVEGK